MRLAFIGCVQFSAACLTHVIDRRFSRVQLVGVVTRKSSSYNTDFQSLEPIAVANQLPLLMADGADQFQLAEWLRECHAEVVLCLGWSSLLKKCILDVPPIGVIGYHATPLPRNRGRHPIIWTLALGLRETASTFFFMDEGADSGDILSQRRIFIDDREDAGSLYRKLTASALSQIDEFVPALVNGSYQRISQDHTCANYWRKRTRLDGLIDWRMPAANIVNLVRALAPPYPGAHCVHHSQEIKIWEAQLVDIRDVDHLEPGKVLTTGGGDLIVKCGVGAVRIIKHEFSTLPDQGTYL